MKAIEQNVWDLFSNHQFKIPLYQRHYDWTDEQCHALWDDFVRLCETTESSHYLGTMVVEQRDGVYLIVDGQQRTTSLMLLLKALQEQVGLSEDQRASLRSLTHVPSGEPRLVPQHTDRPYFRAVMAAPSGHNPGITGNAAFQTNFLGFVHRLKHDTAGVAGSDTHKMTLDHITSALRRMSLALIELERDSDDHDAPQTVFEKMNATGEELKVHDLIRNYLFMLAAESPNSASSSPNRQDSASSKQRSLYVNEWQNLENEFPGRALGQMKHFFRDYLIIKTKKIDVGSGQELYGAFKQYLRHAYPDLSRPGHSRLVQFEEVEKLANDLWRHAAAWTTVTFNKPIGNAPVLRKQITDFSLIARPPYHVFAALLLMHGRADTGQKDNLHNLATVFKTLNKFIVTSLLTGTTTTFNCWLDQFLGIGDDGMVLRGLIAEPNAFASELRKLWPENFDPAKRLEAVFSGDRKGQAAVVDAPEESLSESGSTAQTEDDTPGPRPGAVEHPTHVYVSHRKLTAYVLLKINERIMEKVGDTEVDYIQPDHTLEHIMPQKPDKAEDWRLTDTSFHDTHLHSLGNLTLVGRGFNSQISNRGLGEKLPYYANSSYGMTRHLAEDLREKGVVGFDKNSKMDQERFQSYVKERIEKLTADAVAVLQF